MMVVPRRSVLTRSAAFNTAKCPESVGFARSIFSAISPALMGRLRSSLNIFRRPGCANASNTSLIFRYLAKYGTNVQRPVPSDQTSPRLAALSENRRTPAVQRRRRVVRTRFQRPSGISAKADEPVIHQYRAGHADIDREARRDLHHELASRERFRRQRHPLGPEYIGGAQ